MDRSDLHAFLKLACEPKCTNEKDFHDEEFPSGTPLAERLALFGVAQAVAPRRSLEIGSWCGATLVFLAYASEHTVSVDARLMKGVEDPLSICIALCERCGVADKIEHVSSSSDAYFAQTKETFDFIHIDGNHAYEHAKRDLRNALRCLTPGGLVAMHDARRSDVQAAIRDVITPYRQMVLFSRHPGVALIQDNRGYLRPPIVQSVVRRLPEGLVRSVRGFRQRRLRKERSGAPRG